MRHEGRGSRSRRVPGALARFAIAGARGDEAAVRGAARAARAARALHADLAIWMVEQGYGRVLARPGLGVRPGGR